MRIQALKIGVGILCLGLLGACVSEGDFRTLQSDVRRDASQRDQQIRDLRQQVAEVQGDRDRRGRQLADQVNDLSLLQREIANLRGQVESVTRNHGQLRQDLDALRRRMEAPAAGPVVEPGPPSAPLAPPPPPPPPEKAEDLYKTAMIRFEEGDYAKAREGFTTMVSRYPQAPQSDNAQFWTAECYFREGNFKQAILEYEKVISQYPKSTKIPASLFKQGMAFEKLGDLESARYLYSRVTKDYKGSEQAPMAEQRLKNIP
jgi:tol-pal system protein YbgF